MVGMLEEKCGHWNCYDFRHTRRYAMKLTKISDTPEKSVGMKTAIFLGMPENSGHENFRLISHTYKMYIYNVYIPECGFKLQYC